MARQQYIWKGFLESCRPDNLPLCRLRRNAERPSDINSFVARVVRCMLLVLGNLQIIENGIIRLIEDKVISRQDFSAALVNSL